MRKESMLTPVADITELATGMPEPIPYVPPQVLPPSPVDPAVYEFMKGNDPRGTRESVYDGSGLLQEDETTGRAIRMDRGWR